MSHDNRGRITVDQSGPWPLYQPTTPAGHTMIGTVTRAGLYTGALARVEATGLYVQLNAGVIRLLDQRKVKAALSL